MSRSTNNQDTNWKREWEEEQTLTPEEQKEAAKLKKIEDQQTAQMLEDLHMLRMEIDLQEEEEKRKLRYARSYLKEHGWSNTAIWMLSDDEVLKAADAESEREWEEDIPDYEYWEEKA